jgi:hypothetical protein
MLIKVHKHAVTRADITSLTLLRLKLTQSVKIAEAQESVPLEKGKAVPVLN